MFIRAIAIISVGLFASACMDPLHDYQECVKIETARCDLRQRCLETSKPDSTFMEEFSDFDYDTCIAYLKENCRTREIGGDKPEQKVIDNCVAAILKVACNTLRKADDETARIKDCDFIDRPPEDTNTEDKDSGPDAG